MIYINIKRDEPIFQVRRVDRGINIHSMGKRGLQGDTGVQGPKGDSGLDGIIGVDGLQGDTGEKGDTGFGLQGIQGDSGSQGLQGDTGEQGDTGVGLTGATGVTGPQGNTGVKGDTGTGIQGATGVTGSQGDTGAAGAKGDTGTQGDTGVQGIQGVKGDTGTTGVTGAKGDTGNQGVKGDTGNTGSQGTHGDTGVTGAKGDTGNTGSQGVKGDTGTAGTTGVKGDTGAGIQGDTGVTGNQGDTGIQGEDGGNAGKIFYLTNNASDIGGYTKALASPSPDAETTIVQANTGTGDTLVGSFATEPAEPAVTALPAGTAFRHFHITTGASNQVGRLKVELYKRTAGGTETLLRSGYSDSFFGTSIQEIIWQYTDPSGYALDVTDRIIFKVYTARVSGAGTCTITIYLEGTTHASYVQTTISAGAKGEKGDTGTAGSQGVKGDTGTQGVKGDTGSAGSQGIQGDTGQGVQGNTGVKGDTGNTGSQGAKGDTGNAGSQGATGVTGSQGNTGVKGDTGAKPAGQLYLSAAGMWPTTTAGCASNAKTELATNDINIYTLDFDATTQEYAEVSLAMPSDWDGGTITAVFYWTHPSTTTNFGVVWNLAGRSYTNDDALDQALGTAQQIADIGGTTNDLYITGATPAITITGAGASEYVHFKVSRVTGDGSDNMAVDAKLIGVMINYTRV